MRGGGGGVEGGSNLFWGPFVMILIRFTILSTSIMIVSSCFLCKKKINKMLFKRYKIFAVYRLAVKI